jgi:antitoxin component YwqK of YwqJK toxin-antitoxin module
MIKFLPAICLLIFTGHGFAQKDSIRKYLDANLDFTTKKEAAYAAMVTKENDRWLLSGVYPDSTVLLNIFYKDAALTINDGSFTLYFPGKVVAQKGNFVNNIPQGHWQSFYQNGQTRDEGEIIDGHFSGTWNAFYENGLPKSTHNYIYEKVAVALGEPVHEHSPAKKILSIVRNFAPEGKLDGATFTWYENGNRESVVHYQNDTLTGLCTWYRPNGKPSSIETYTYGKLTDLECYDTAGNYTGATCSVSKLPVFISVFSAEDYI